MPKQLALPFELAPSYGRDDFLVGKPNEAAFAYLARWPRWLSPAAVLSGPEGAGKSHLAAIFAAQAEARVLRADHLDFADVPYLAQAKALVLEDSDRFPPDERALFHLLNLARETGVFVVLTARQPPDHWNLATPDLLSRLRAQPLLTLAEPDDALLDALLVKLFADRQIGIRPNLMRYILARAPRSYAAISALVAAIDRETLVSKTAPTRTLLARLLGDVEPDEDEDGL